MVVAAAAKQCPGGSVFIPGLVFVDVVLTSVRVQPLSFSSQSKAWAVRDKTPGLTLC